MANPIETGYDITWSDLISQAEANLQQNIENLQGASIPVELTATPINISSANAVIQVSHGPRYIPVVTKATSNRVWSTVSWNTVKADFHRFLQEKKLDTNDRGSQLVSTRLILNFYENLSLFYMNRLIIVYTPINNIKRLYYYDDGNAGAHYENWAGTVTNIEDPVNDSPVTAQEVSTLLSSINTNLKNKIKTYNQTYTFTTSSSSSCSSCSSSSSSSSSCWTIIHQDLKLL